jgi:ubiquinone/menaquinone biosynthesis C-methylase UbiE
MANSKLDFWNSRAQFGDQAGTGDLPLKSLEMQILLDYIKEGQNILDLGCGNGVTAFYLLDRMKIRVTGIDFAERMIDEANRRSRTRSAEEQRMVEFAVGDVCHLSRVPAIAGKQFDVIITERVLINLASWKEQEAAIRGIIDLLTPNGVYLMLESLEEGLRNINRVRKAIGLGAIEKPWHNRYLHEREILSIDFADLVEYRDFSSAYYFLSRVVNAWVAKKNNAEPRYDSDINQVALHLVGLRDFESIGLGQTRLWVWRRKR